MKKLIIIFLLTVPTITMAQSEWEIPDAQKPAAEQKVEKKDVSTAEHKKKGINPKYGVGAVPEVEGKVEWNHTIKLPGLSAEQIYEQGIAAITELTKQPNQSDKSRLTAVNKHDHIIAAYIDEEMVFATSFLSKDYTDFRYTLIITAKDGEAQLRMCRMSYAYEMNRSTGKIYTAEELLPDSEAMNKKHTRLFPMNGKFRRTTIDRKDEVFAFIEQQLIKK